MPDLGIELPGTSDVGVTPGLIAFELLGKAAIVESFRVVRVEPDGLVVIRNGTVELAFGEVGGGLSRMA